jgi:putative transposase
VAKATATIRQQLNSAHGEWLHANQALLNHVAAFYFDVIQAHVGILDLSNKQALSELEKLTHATRDNPNPIMPLSDIQTDIPAMFRRAGINAALGSARSFFSHLMRWQKAKAKAESKGKKFTQRPPVPPRTWNKSATLYAGMWKERTGSGMLIKVWSGTCWSWIRVRITGRDIPDGFDRNSPSLVRRGKQWWLHTPVEKKIKSAGQIETQMTAQPETRICAVDLNINEHVAVATIQDVEGSILATRFIGGGQRVSGFRKRVLGHIARKRSQTGTIAKGEQDNADLWTKIRHGDEHVAHLVSARIVQFAQQHQATVLVFEHLGNLKPAKGKYSKRGNEKRAFWMKGRIFNYARYKAYNVGILTSRVSPKNTSRECAKCGAPVARYAEGQPAEGYQMGAPLCKCENCGMAGNADRNASIVIGHRLFERFAIARKEKPPTRPATDREEQSSGVVALQEPQVQVVDHSFLCARHESSNGHGTAQGSYSGMAEPVRDFTDPLRSSPSRIYDPIAQSSDYAGESEAAGL